MKKTICRRRGSGFRAPPPGGKKPFADEGGQGLGPPPGGKKPFADEGGQGLGPPRVEKNHLPTKGVRV